MSGSVSQYCMRSLPDRSARLPAETNDDSPRLRSAAAARILDAQRAGLAEEAHAARWRQVRRQGRVERHLRGEVDDAERARPDDPHAVGPGVGDEPALRGEAGRAGLAEPRGDDDEPPHALRETGVEHPGHLVGRDGQDGQVDVVGDSVTLG